MANKNLHYLTDRLPKSNYANGHEYEKVAKLSQSTKAKNTREMGMVMHPYPNKNNNLPKLDRVLIRGHGNYKSPVLYHQDRERERGYIRRHAADIDVSNLLKIEGRSNQRNYQYDDPKRVLDRDLKAELRRIYNLKPSPSKHDRQLKPIYRHVELPRIN